MCKPQSRSSCPQRGLCLAIVAYQLHKLFDTVQEILRIALSRVCIHGKNFRCDQNEPGSSDQGGVGACNFCGGGGSGLRGSYLQLSGEESARRCTETAGLLRFPWKRLLQRSGETHKLPISSNYFLLRRWGVCSMVSLFPKTSGTPAVPPQRRDDRSGLLTLNHN